MRLKRILIGLLLFWLTACAPRMLNTPAPLFTLAPTATRAPIQRPTVTFTTTVLPTSTPMALPTSTATTTLMPSPTATLTPLLELQFTQQQAYSNTITFTTTRGLTRTALMRYLLYVPRNYTPDQAWPLILFLHGSSEGGDDVNQVRREGLPKLLETNPDFPFVVVSPQNPADVPWADNLPELNGLIDFIQEHYAIDPQRLSVTGLSMGGYGTWQLASLYPQRFAALVPIAGGYDYYRPGVPPRNICALKAVPMWVFHGERDTIVEVSRAQPLVEALQECGGQVKFTLYPDADHRATWERAYHDPELYRWLAEQRRP
jgi:predicted peptidase